jgi:integrase
MAMARGLTALKIENVKPNPEQRREIADAGKPGLYLVVHPSGKKSWAVRYRRLADKKPCKYTLEGFPSLGVARKLAQDVLDQVAEGKDPAAQKQVDKRVVHEAESDTFADVVVQFINRDQRPGNRTWRETARVLGLKEAGEDLQVVKGGLVDRWGKRRIGEIKRREIIDLVDGIADDAPVMANRTLAAIRRFFNWCVEKDRVQFSPCAGVKQREENHRTRVLDDDEIRLFWRACDKLKFPYGPAAKMLLLTGARRSEVGGVTLEEIKEGVWTIPGARTKNGNAHAVPLSRAALAVLQDAPSIKGARGLVFTLNGRAPFTSWHLIRGQIHELMEKDAGAKIEPWRLHDLRRTMASGMAKLGIQLPVIERCLNHVSGSFAGIVGVYQQHKFESEMRAAFEMWADHVERVATGKRADVIHMRGRG